MSLPENIQFPPQQKSFKSKGIKWRKACVDWADNKTYVHYSPVRKTVHNMKINQDLVNGILHMEDLQAIVNPTNTKANYIPENIQHFAIMNAKLNVLRGEESRRLFDWKVIVTNPNSISEIENNKKNELAQKLQEMIANNALSEDEFNAELEKLNYFFQYEWQDVREIRANAILSHYIKEYNMPKLFNNGFMDAMMFGEEVYLLDIVGGEPIIEKLNPMKLRAYKSGYSSNIEDADIVVIEDYWSPGKIIDRYYDVLTEKDRKYIEEVPTSTESGAVDSFDNYDERAGFVRKLDVNDCDFYSTLFDGVYADDNSMPYDILGNLRVIRVYWKSRRKIKKVKSYDQMTGEEIYNFYPETYVCNEAMGEEELIFWINEAWEGTKIGDRIYVNMRPRLVQYNRLSNPSRCHFGIIGSVYNLNDDKPFSLVDMMKPYAYYYDVIHDRLNKLIEKNWGKIIVMDFAKVPDKWSVEKWLYYAKINNLAIVDSFKEGNKGAATGKLAGGLNNASSGVIDAELGNSIQLYITLLEYIKGEMSDTSGISRQREGLISNRETVGGVERATLQSSHITEWLFVTHEDIKKRVLEAFLETAKIALRGRKKKFQYILNDGLQKLIEIDGDLFAESDYGLVTDNSDQLQNLQSKLDMLAQAALQNQYHMSTIMKLFTSTSIIEKIRMIENEEQQREQQAQQAQQEQMQIQQQQIQQQAATAQALMEQQYKMNAENNETKILVAEINGQAEAERFAMMNQDDGVLPMSDTDKARIDEMARQFDAKLKLEKEKLQFDKDKASKELLLKRMQINKKSSTSK